MASPTRIRNSRSLRSLGRAEPPPPESSPRPRHRRRGRRPRLGGPPGGGAPPAGGGGAWVGADGAAGVVTAARSGAPEPMPCSEDGGDNVLVGGGSDRAPRLASRGDRGRPRLVGKPSAPNRISRVVAHAIDGRSRTHPPLARRPQQVAAPRRHRYRGRRESTNRPLDRTDPGFGAWLAAAARSAIFGHLVDLPAPLRSSGGRRLACP